MLRKVERGQWFDFRTTKLATNLIPVFYGCHLLLAFIVVVLPNSILTYLLTCIPTYYRC
jgi:hypothetical protein